MPDFALPETPDSETPAGPVMLEADEMQELFLALEAHVFRLERLAVKWSCLPHRGEWYARRAASALSALSKFNQSRIDAPAAPVRD